jgi:D-alanyl-D-alanine carboxypeptidase (penicillin-binding protein 5/6)
MIHHHAKQYHIEFPIIYGLAVLAVIVLSHAAQPLSHRSSGVIAPSQATEASGVVSPLFQPSAFNSVAIHGKAYVVYDVMSESVIAAKNENEVLPLASLTKIMMMTTARLHHDKDTLITIHPNSIEDGYDLGLKKNQIWKLNELLKYTLVFSSNDGALEIANNLGGVNSFVNQMNTDAQLLNFPLMFTDPAGRDLGGKIGGQGSALTVAKLFSFARKNFPEVLDATTKTRLTVLTSSGKLTGVPNTNQDIDNLAGAEVSKTGFTDMAGGNLGVVVDITVGHPVVIIVLGSSKDARFSDVEVLYKALRSSVGQPVK